MNYTYFIFNNFFGKASMRSLRRKAVLLFLILTLCGSLILHLFEHHLENFESSPTHHHSWMCLLESLSGPEAPMSQPDSSHGSPVPESGHDCPMCLALQAGQIVLLAFLVCVLFLLDSLLQAKKKEFGLKTFFERSPLQFLPLTALPRAALPASVL